MATFRDIDVTSDDVNVGVHVNIMVVKQTFPPQVMKARKGDNMLGFHPYCDIRHN